ADLARSAGDGGSRLSGHRRRELVRGCDPGGNAQGNCRAAQSRDQSHHCAPGHRESVGGTGLRAGRHHAGRFRSSDQGRYGKMGQGDPSGQHQGGVAPAGRHTGPTSQNCYKVWLIRMALAIVPQTAADAAPIIATAARRAKESSSPSSSIYAREISAITIAGATLLKGTGVTSNIAASNRTASPTKRLAASKAIGQRG